MDALTDLQRRLFILEQKQKVGAVYSQLPSSSIGDTDIDDAEAEDDTALSLGEVIADAATTTDALPDVQTAVETTSDYAGSVADLLVINDDELDARLDDMHADLDLKAEELADADQQIRDAFGRQIGDLSDKVDEIVAGAGGILILYSQQAPTSTDKAPAGSVWWMLDASKNIAGQWQQTGTDDSPTWTPRPIQSDVIANLDVGKLTAGQAAIVQVVAQKIAASTASIQTVNVGNLFVTQGATMAQAVIDYLFANVVQAKKITADMIDVNSLNGITITGATLQTATSGRRIELNRTGYLNFYGASGSQPIGQLYADSSLGLLFKNPSAGDSSYVYLAAGGFTMQDSTQNTSVRVTANDLKMFGTNGATVALNPTSARLQGTNGVAYVGSGDMVQLIGKRQGAADGTPTTVTTMSILGSRDQAGGAPLSLAKYGNDGTGTITGRGEILVGAPEGASSAATQKTADGWWDLTADEMRAQYAYLYNGEVGNTLKFKDGTVQQTAYVAQDTGWLYPTLTNGWANQSGTRLRYRVKNGVVYLQGYLNSANATATVFATLPSNLTPSQNIRVPATNGTGSSGSWMDFPVGSNGNLASNTGNNPNFAVSWPTDQ